MAIVVAIHSTTAYLSEVDKRPFDRSIGVSLLLAPKHNSTQLSTNWVENNTFYILSSLDWPPRRRLSTEHLDSLVISPNFLPCIILASALYIIILSSSSAMVFGV